MTAPLVTVDALGIDLVRHGAVERRLVDDLSFTIGAGEVFAIVGESGSGKTIAARSILGLLPPTMRIGAGSIRFDGRGLASLTPRDLRRLRGRDIGMIFQEPMTSLNPSVPIGRQIAEAIRLHEGLSARAAHVRTIEMLHAVRILDPERACRSYPHQFSGGMRQRIMIASVLAMRPKLLIADEPTTALDALIRREVMALMLDLARDAGTAILLISHDLGMVAEHARRVLVMRHGTMIESGATRDVLLAPRHPYTRSLLDSLPVSGDCAPVVDAAPLVTVDSLDVAFAPRRKMFARTPAAVAAVSAASFTIRRGETLALVGESGSGKTTLGRTLLGLNAGVDGAITFDGEALDVPGAARSQGFRSRTTMIFQDPGGSLDPRMRLVDIVAEPLRRAGRLGAGERRRRAERALDEVGLGGRYARNFPHELSGGQRQRVAIARAIIAEPDLVVADEPVSALDPSVQHQVLALLADLQARHGFANLFISHDLGVVEQIATRVAVMYRGRMLEIGPRDAIFGSPRHPYTIRLLEAAPRIARAGDGGFALTTVSADGAPPPEGFAWFDADDRAATMIEVAPAHWVACAAHPL